MTMIFKENTANNRYWCEAFALQLLIRCSWPGPSSFCFPDDIFLFSRYKIPKIDMFFLLFPLILQLNLYLLL